MLAFAKDDENDEVDLLLIVPVVLLLLLLLLLVEDTVVLFYLPLSSRWEEEAATTTAAAALLESGKWSTYQMLNISWYDNMLPTIGCDANWRSVCNAFGLLSILRRLVSKSPMPCTYCIRRVSIIVSMPWSESALWPISSMRSVWLSRKTRASSLAPMSLIWLSHKLSETSWRYLCESIIYAMTFTSSSVMPFPRRLRWAIPVRSIPAHRLGTANACATLNCSNNSDWLCSCCSFLLSTLPFFCFSYRICYYNAVGKQCKPQN